MFGLFKRKKKEEKKEEEIVNRSIFLSHFTNIFKDYDLSEGPLGAKLGTFSSHLSMNIVEKAKGKVEISELSSYEKCATIIIFHQTLFNVTDFVELKNKILISKLLSSLSLQLISKDPKKPTPEDKANLALSRTTYTMLGKDHVHILEGISNDCLEWLFHRDEKSMSRLVTQWEQIVSILISKDK